MSERSLALAFGIRGGGAYWKKKRAKRDKNESADLPEYLSAGYLQPYIGNELREHLFSAIRYMPKGLKVVATGLEATVLPEICDVFIRAEKAGAIPIAQKNVSELAYTLLKGFAHVGIIALVDEATGFQEIRDKLDLQKILDKYLLQEYAKWAKRFPDEFYEEMFRLRGWQYNGMSVKRPSVVGKYTNDIVYARLAPGVLDKLKELNPKNDRGQKKAKDHQYLTPETGVPELDKHLHAVIALMKAAPGWAQFERMLARSFPKFNEQIPLALED